MTFDTPDRVPRGVGKFGNVRKNFPLSKSAFKPFMLYEEEGIDDMVRGLTTQSSQKFDRFFTKEVSRGISEGSLSRGCSFHSGRDSCSTILRPNTLVSDGDTLRRLGTVRGLSILRALDHTDSLLVFQVTNHLFQNDLPFGLDLVALNLQRGRDHGLPGYTEWRQVCGLRRPRSWADLEDIMEPDVSTNSYTRRSGEFQYQSYGDDSNMAGPLWTIVR